MTPKIRYGGDYNPEQWPREVWDEDHRLFTRSGIDTLTVDRPSRNRGRRPGSSSGSSSRGAEPVATYGADFYAGTPAVTRNGRGSGEAWYVATALDQPGVDQVVGRVLTRHDLLGPYAGHPAVETATRVAPDGTRLLFLLNHAPRPARLTAHAPATDLHRRTGGPG